MGSLMRCVNPSCFRLVSSPRSSAIVPRKMRNVQSVHTQQRGEEAEPRSREREGGSAGAPGRLWLVSSPADQASTSATHGASNVRPFVPTASCRCVQVRLKYIGAHVSDEFGQCDRRNVDLIKKEGLFWPICEEVWIKILIIVLHTHKYRH